MTLTELSTTRYPDGLTEITVIVDRNRTYSFTLSSAYDYAQFKKLLRKKPGAALNYLKKWNIGKEDR